METNSTGRLVFKKIISYFEVNKVHSKHLIRITTDGAPSMISKYCELITHFKKLNPDIFVLHNFSTA